MQHEEAQRLCDGGLQDLITSLENGKSENLLRYLATMARFHRYSFGNCLLIAIQKPDATMVAGFQRWKELGRFVKKGERGIGILAPLMSRGQKAEEDQEEAETTPRKLRGFRVVHVFDVSQTEGAELPDFAGVAGDVGDFHERLEALVGTQGIKLRYELLMGGAMGASDGGKFTVVPNLPPAEKFSVLCHELAHELLHRGERRKATTATIRETEAEAVAYVVCQAVGLESRTHSADYIQLWSGDKEVLLESLDHVQRAASFIISELLTKDEVPMAAVA